MSSDLQFLPLSLVTRAHEVAESGAGVLSAEIIRLLQDAYTQGYADGHARGAVDTDMRRRAEVKKR